jgi:hypothetical protein
MGEFGDSGRSPAFDVMAKSREMWNGSRTIQGQIRTLVPDSKLGFILGDIFSKEESDIVAREGVCAEGPSL